jgi:large subunit ribosomal protein L6
VKVNVADRAVTVEGKLGKLEYRHRPEIDVRVDDDHKTIVCTRKSEDRAIRAYHGLTRALINNMLVGVTQGYEKKLEIQVGQFAAEVRAVRKPEPYKGKGIRYEGEQVRRKAGKTAT